MKNRFNADIRAVNRSRSQPVLTRTNIPDFRCVALHGPALIGFLDDFFGILFMPAGDIEIPINDNAFLERHGRCGYITHNLSGFQQPHLAPCRDIPNNSAGNNHGFGGDISLDLAGLTDDEFLVGFNFTLKLFTRTSVP